MTPATLLAAAAGVLAAAGLLEASGASRARATSPRCRGARRGPGVRGRASREPIARALRSAGRRIAGTTVTGTPGGLAARVDAAGLRASVPEAMAAKLAAAPVAGGLALLTRSELPGRLGFVVLLGAPILGYFAPDVWLRARGRARARAMEAEQADVLDLLRVALGAGLGVWRALGEVGRRHPGQLATELGSAARRVGLGVPARIALARLERRCPAAGTRALVEALRRADRFGASPDRALAALAADARARQARQAAEAAARAAPKIQLVVALLLVPSVLLLVAAALVPALAGATW